MKRPVIGYAGLTHLGLNSAVASAARGFNVIGYHDDEALVKQFKKGTPYVKEPQLAELMCQHSTRLIFTIKHQDLAGCDIVYISADVPTDDEGLSDLRPILKIIDLATSVMRSDAILVILCQVPPGFTRQIKWPPDRLIYQVETLIFGRAIERAMNPERFIIGVADPVLALPESLVSYLGAFECPVLPMRYESAELAKISINICLAGSISITNSLAEVCEKINADWSEIVPALRMDKRIGHHAYLSPGLGISGGNLERDLATILRFAEQYETDGSVVAAFIANSQYRRDWALRILRQFVLNQNPDVRISLLGLTYKENTNSLKNSPAIALLNALAPHPLIAYDPVAVVEVCWAHVTLKSTVLDAISGTDVLVIMTPWPEFRSITMEQLRFHMNGRTVLDPYRVLDGKTLISAGFTYFTLGAQATIQEIL
jgi:UDPglucose 6-dehydrogenase